MGHPPNRDPHQDSDRNHEQPEAWFAQELSGGPGSVAAGAGFFGWLRVAVGPLAHVLGRIANHTPNRRKRQQIQVME